MALDKNTAKKFIYINMLNNVRTSLETRGACVIYKKTIEQKVTIMNPPPRAPKQHASSKETQRTGATSTHTTVAQPPTAQRQTTFLTVDSGNRAPSAYHVNVQGDSIGNSQRARQEHRSGPTVTREKHAVHAFIPNTGNAQQTKDMQRATAKITADMVTQTGMDPQMALRLNIMDGLAVPTASHGAQHIEAFQGNLSRGNPHRSGGTVAFPDPQSNLSKYDLVKATTAQMKRENANSKGPTKPITGGVGANPSSVQQFNHAATKEQQRFAQSILKPK